MDRDEERQTHKRGDKDSDGQKERRSRRHGWADKSGEKIGDVVADLSPKFVILAIQL